MSNSLWDEGGLLGPGAAARRLAMMSSKAAQAVQAAQAAPALYTFKFLAPKGCDAERELFRSRGVNAFQSSDMIYLSIKAESEPAARNTALEIANLCGADYALHDIHPVHAAGVE